MERRCENCEYYEKTEDTHFVNDIKDFDGWGSCHRYPPTNINLLPSDMSWEDMLCQQFPKVECIDWCGEFKPREEGNVCNQKK